MDYGSGDDETRELTQKEINEMKVRRDETVVNRYSKIYGINLKKNLNNLK